MVSLPDGHQLLDHFQGRQNLRFVVPPKALNQADRRIRVQMILKELRPFVTHLTLRGPTSLDYLKHVFLRPFPILENLQLHLNLPAVARLELSPWNRVFAQILRNCPNLRVLTLDTVSQEDLSTALAPNVRNVCPTLRELVLMGAYVNDAEDLNVVDGGAVIRRFPNLTKLRLLGDWFFGTQDGADSTAPHILEHVMEMPRLRLLEYEINTGTIDNERLVFRDFLESLVCFRTLLAELVLTTRIQIDPMVEAEVNDFWIRRREREAECASLGGAEGSDWHQMKRLCLIIVDEDRLVLRTVESTGVDTLVVV